MRLRILLLLLLVTSRLVHAQDSLLRFSPNEFPPSQYKISEKSFAFHQINLIFHIVKDIRKGSGRNGECRIYLTINKDDSIIIQKSVGDTWLEGLYAIPTIQPLDKYFMINYYGEWGGEITLIDSLGKIITFPGYKWAVTKDKKYIFTKANYPDSELPAIKFDVETGKYITKNWHLSLQGEPWSEIETNEYQDYNSAISFCPN